MPTHVYISVFQKEQAAVTMQPHISVCVLPVLDLTSSTGCQLLWSDPGGAWQFVAGREGRRREP